MVCALGIKQKKATWVQSSLRPKFCITFQLDYTRFFFLNRTEDLSLLATRSFLVKVFRLHGRPYSDSTVSYYYYYSYFLDKFCARDISRTIHRFFIKLSGMMCSYMPLLILEEFLNTSLLVPSYGHFPDFKMKFCQFEIQGTTKDMNWRLVGEHRARLLNMRKVLFVCRQYFRSLPEAN